MIFSKKNKINKSIDNISDDTISQEIDNEFELLTKVKRKNAEKNILNRIFVYPFVSLWRNIKEKSLALWNYLINNYEKVLFWFICILAFVTFIIGFWIIFSPYPASVNGNIQIPISNFYLGLDGKPSGLTPIGIAFIILFAFLIGLLIFYIIQYRVKTDKFIVKLNKDTIAISITTYVLILISFIFMFVLIVIPPNVIVSAQQQEIYYLANNINNSIGKVPENEILQQIQKLSDLTKEYNVTPLTNVSVDAFNDWYVNSGWYYNMTNGLDMLIYSNQVGSTAYTINLSGKLIISFVTIVFACAFIIFPFTLLCIISFNAINENNENLINNWSSFRLWFFNLLERIKSFFKNIKNKHKNKDSFHKYKKRSKNKGILTSETTDNFTTDTSKNKAVKQVITVEEIESNPKNIAFLNKEGKWMYHDGNHHYYIANGNVWEPYDVNQEIHRAYANIVDENLNFDPASKVAKEQKLKLFKSKKESSIALPDEEIERIAKELNI